MGITLEMYSNSK